MKLIKKPEFTQWWLHSLSERLRSKHKYLDEASSKLDNTHVYITWVNCIGRNKRKMESVYQGQRLYNLITSDDWTRCISWQKKR